MGEPLRGELGKLRWCGSVGAPSAPQVLPNPSLNTRPSAAGCLARGTAFGHHRSRGQVSQPLRAR